MTGPHPSLPHDRVGLGMDWSPTWVVANLDSCPFVVECQVTISY
jgi:hypothetical protein